MAQLACNECDKAFKTQTGFEWHMGRNHESRSVVLEEDKDTSADEAELHVDSVSTRLEFLEIQVEALQDSGADLDICSQLRDQLINVQEEYRNLRASVAKLMEKDSLRFQAVESEMLEARRLASKGAQAQENVVALAEFIKEELIPALSANFEKPKIDVYPDQEAIDKLPKCSYCGESREEGRRTCGQLECVAKVLRIGEAQTS